jgi:hypothetical protein
VLGVPCMPNYHCRVVLWRPVFMHNAAHISCVILGLQRITCLRTLHRVACLCLVWPATHIYMHMPVVGAAH